MRILLQNDTSFVIIFSFAAIFGSHKLDIYYPVLNLPGNKYTPMSFFNLLVIGKNI